MLRRYPHRDAGIAATLVFGLAGLLLGGAAGFLVTGVSAALVAPVGAAVAGIVAFLSFASESDRRPPIIWQGAAADGVVTGITSGIVIAVIVALVGNRAGTSSGPSVSSVALDMGLAIVIGTVAGGGLGVLTMLVGGTSRMTRLPPKRPSNRRKRRQGRKRR